MNNSHVASQIIDYLEGTLSHDERGKVELHISICEHCKQLVQQVSQTYCLIDQERNVSVNPFFYTRLMAKLEKSKSRSLIQDLISVVWKPAIIVLAVVIGITIGNGEIQLLEEQDMEAEVIADNFLPADYQDVVLTFETEE